MKNMLQLSLFACLLTCFSQSSSAQNSTPLWKTLPDLVAMPVPDTSGLAAVNDIQLYFAIFNAKGKDPVLLLHGGLGSSEYWCREVPLLATKHKVIVVDSRGHGRSTMSAQPFSYALLTSDVQQLMNQLHLPKASIVGWSDGGIIGLLMAMESPERINKLFTFGTNYSHSGEKSDPPDTAMGRKYMRQVTESYRRLSPTPDSFPALRRALFKMYNAEPELDTARLKLISAPTVIACGQYDQFYTQEHFSKLASLIPRAKLLVLPNISHGGPLQDPVAFHKAVSDFLDKR